MIRQPSSVIVAGPSGSGKTVLMQHLLTFPYRVLTKKPDRMVYAYDRWQPRFEEMQPFVTFFKGIPTTAHLDKWFAKTNGGVLVLDDLMEEGGRDKSVLDLFTKDSHHRNITVFYLAQDIFPPGKFSKTINRNAHYIIAFKNPRDKTGLRTVLLQAFPDRWRSILHLLEWITDKPFSYLMLDLHPASDDRYRLWSKLTPSEGNTTVHTSKKDEPGTTQSRLCGAPAKRKKKARTACAKRSRKSHSPAGVGTSSPDIITAAMRASNVSPAIGLSSGGSPAQTLPRVRRTTTTATTTSRRTTAGKRPRAACKRPRRPPPAPPSSSDSNGSPSTPQRPPRTNAEMRRQLEQLHQEELEPADDEEIRNITRTSTITTVYDKRRPPRVQRISTRTGPGRQTRRVAT